MCDIAVKKATEVTTFMTPQSFGQALKIAETLSKSGLVPSAYKDKAADIVVAMAWGAELGLPPLSAIQNIAVINGRPALWGDAVLAIVKTKPDYEYVKESFDEATMTATCIAKRKGEPESKATFSQKDAEDAGLWGRSTWKAYPRRMLQMRARSFAIRDAFPHHMKGIGFAEEVQDYDRPAAPAKQYITDPLKSEDHPEAIEGEIELLPPEPKKSEEELKKDKIFYDFAAIGVPELRLLEFFGEERKEDIPLEWLEAEETRDFYKECKSEFKKSRADIEGPLR